MRMRTRAESACLQVYRAWRKCILPCPGCAQLNFRFARTLGRWAGPFLWILIKIHFVSCRLKLRTVFLGCRKPPHNWLVMWVGPPLDGWVWALEWDYANSKENQDNRTAATNPLLTMTNSRGIPLSLSRLN